MNTKISLFALILFATGQAGAAVVYSQDFEVNDTANWTVNNGPSDAAADFFFDYATVGVPLAPNSSGAGTRGMKLQANLSSGVFSGMSASPTGLDLSGPYTLSFDWWSNTVGPFPAGGSGSTNLSTYGVGTSGTVAQWPSQADGVWFAATNEGNSAADWRVYSPDMPTSHPDGDPVYTAPGGSRNASDPYYAGFGNVAPPAAQTVLYPGQAGTVQAGAAAFAWHEVEIFMTEDEVRWIVDGLEIAAVDISAMVLGGGNIFFGHSDTNATSSADPNDAALLFTLIDNVRIEQARVSVAEPGTLVLLALALPLIGFGRLRSRIAQFAKSAEPKFPYSFRNIVAPT